MVVNEKAKIDSFQVFMPLNTVTLRNEDEYKYVTVHKSTGDVIKETQPKMFREDRGIKVSMNVDTRPWGRANTTKGVIITVPSKILGANYFDGINKDNLRDVYDYLNNWSDDLDIPLESFLKGRASDIDICKDMPLLNPSEYSEFKKQMKAICQAVGIQNYNSKKKGEFYISHREYADLYNPFSKIYQKPQEYKSSEHRLNFFSEYDSRIQVTRAEVTMKDKKMLQRYSSNGFKNSSVLGVITGDYSSIVENVFDHYFVKKGQSMNAKEFIEATNLRGLDMLVYGFFRYELDHGTKLNDFELIDYVFERMTYSVDVKDKKVFQRTRKRVERIYNEYFFNKTLERLNNFNNYIKGIGLLN